MHICSCQIDTDHWVVDEVMADEVAMMEQLELEALVSSQKAGVAEHISTVIEDTSTPTNTNYGSDDEDYDSIFQDVIREEQSRMSQQDQQNVDGLDHDMMDMS